MGLKKTKAKSHFWLHVSVKSYPLLKKKVQRAAALNQMIKTTCCASGLETMC